MKVESQVLLRVCVCVFEMNSWTVHLSFAVCAAPLFPSFSWMRHTAAGLRFHIKAIKELQF